MFLTLTTYSLPYTQQVALIHLEKYVYMVLLSQ